MNGKLKEFIENLKLAGGEVLEEINDEWYVVEGEFGVAENGAVWISEYKKELFLSENLAIKVKEIVPTMHEAMQKINSPGVFISGPSKTADIEMFLVFGAHGAKRVGVIIEN